MPRPTKLGVTIQSCGAIIWLASWIVPKPLRSEWRALWRIRTWHWANFLAETRSLDAGNCTDPDAELLGRFSGSLLDSL